MDLRKYVIALLTFLTSFTLSLQLQNDTLSLLLPLNSLPFSPQSTKTLFPNLIASQPKSQVGAFSYKTPFKYSMALVISLPIGTPPQNQQMVIDTGSQLSWIQCHKKTPQKPPPTTSFDPSLSSSFSVIPCNHPMCKPRIPDFTLPTSCDQKKLCHYSYFYADGTLAEGNLVREKITFSKDQSTPPLILGCAEENSDNKGILGLNFGRLSFSSQAKISRFSYCVPARISGGVSPTGSFYLGSNPSSSGFKYVNLLRYGNTQRMPNLDPLAYTVALQGIRIGPKKLVIPAKVFIPDASGSGQTMIDSGTEFTYLVEEAYVQVRAEVVKLVGTRLKKGYVYGGVLDMCFDRIHIMEIQRLVGTMAFEFEKGVEIVIEQGRTLADVGGGVWCMGIGRSDGLGIPSNIIGNFHQQNQWVEFDLENRRVGFGTAVCSRSI